MQLATFPTRAKCPLPNCLTHWHDLWAHEFLIPAISILLQEMFVPTKFTAKVQMWMGPVVWIIHGPELRVLGQVTSRSPE